MKLTRRQFVKLGLAAGASLLLPRIATADGPPSILWIGWDGADYRTVTGLVRAGLLPNLANLNLVRLDCAGATCTKPGWVEIINGLEYPQTGVRSNDAYTKVPLEEILFWRIRDALPTYWGGCIFSKVHHTGDQYVYDPDDGVWKYEPWYNLGQHWNECLNSYIHANPTAFTIEQTNGYLWTALEGYTAPGLMFCHYCKPDETGHNHGMDSPEYLNDLTLLDAALGEAIDVMKPDYVIVCSDHGFDGPGETSHNNAPDAFIASNLPLEHNCVRRDVGYMVDRILGPLPVPLDTGQVPAKEEPLRGKDMRRL